MIESSDLACALSIALVLFLATALRHNTPIVRVILVRSGPVPGSLLFVSPEQASDGPLLIILGYIGRYGCNRCRVLLLVRRYGVLGLESASVSAHDVW